MAIGFGLGIGLQGTPKDYVDLVKSREAAKAKAAAAKGAKEQAAAQRLYEKWTYDLGKATVLPIHEPDRDKIVNDTFAVLESEMQSDTPNFNRANLVTTQARNQLNELAAQKKSFDNFAVKGSDYGFTPQEIAAVGSISDPKQMQEALSQYGVATGYDAASNRFSFNPDLNYKPIDQRFTDYVGDNNDFLFTDKLPKMTENVNGTTIEYLALNPNTEDAFVQSNLNNNSTFYDFKKYKLQMKEPMPVFNSPEYFQQVDGFLRSTYRTLSKPLARERATRPQTSFNFGGGAGDTTPEVGKFSNNFRSLNYGGDRQLSYTSYGSFPLSGQRSIPIPTNYRNIFTLNLEPGSQANLTQGTVELAEVAKRDFTLQLPNGEYKEYKKGEVIPTEWLNKQSNPDYFVEVGLLVTGTSRTGEKGSAQQVAFSGGTQDSFTSNYMKEGEKEKPALKQQFDNMRKTVEQLNTLGYKDRSNIITQYGSLDEYNKAKGTTKPAAPTKAPAAPKSRNASSGGATGGKAAYDRQYWKTRGGFPAWQKSATGK
jgi:hypothetical protein